MILACFLILINHEFVAFFAFDDTFVARAAAPPPPPRLDDDGVLLSESMPAS